MDLQTLAEVLWREDGRVRALIFQNKLQIRDLGTLWASLKAGPTVWQPLNIKALNKSGPYNFG